MKKTLFLLVSISVLVFFIPQNHTITHNSIQTAEVVSPMDHPIYPPL
jgi:hypothetical protein